MGILLRLTILLSLALSSCTTTATRTLDDSRLFFIDAQHREARLSEQDNIDDAEREAIMAGFIPRGLTKNSVYSILGKPYIKYIPDSTMLEVWFYEECYVGFDRQGKVISFRRFTEEN